MLSNFVKVMLYPLAAMVMNTINIGMKDWQYWAILFLMMVLQIITAAQQGLHPTAAGGSDSGENSESGGG